MTPNEKPTGRLIHLSDDGKSTYYMCFTCHEEFNTTEEHDAHLKETGHIKCPHYIARPRGCFTCGEVFYTKVDQQTNEIGPSSHSQLTEHGEKTGHTTYYHDATPQQKRLHRKLSSSFKNK